jgi:hypothetical protein
MEKNKWTDGSEFIHCSGSSSDGRTNRWKITCPECGTTNQPVTTMLNFQTIRRKKKSCGMVISINYNKRIIFLEDEL